MSERYQLLEMERSDSKDLLVDITPDKQDQVQEDKPTIYTVTPPIASTSNNSCTYKIYFKTVAGQRYDLMINQPLESMTILQLKQACNDQHSIPVDLQRLIFSGRELRNDELLGACRIEHESVVHLLLQTTQQQQQQANGQTVMVDLAGADPQVRSVVQDASQLLDSMRMMTIRKQSRQLLMFTMMDILFDFLRFLTDPLFIVPTLAALVGFWAVRNYQRNWMIIYGSGILMQSVLFVVYAVQSNDNGTIALTCIQLLIEGYVLYLVRSFFVLLRHCTDEQTNQLRSLNHGT